MSSDVTIVNCGIGNIRSVQRMFEAVGGIVEIASEPSALHSCRRLVIPGVGSFDAFMEALNSGGWLDSLSHVALEKRVPVLGICLGMQVLCRRSEEGEMNGLGWIAADVVAFQFGANSDFKVPHMGWAVVTPTCINPLISMNQDEERFYHVHKYHASCDSEGEVLATAEYGIKFTTAIRRDNIYGVQFHPEKSHRFGMALMRRFLEITC